MLFVDRLKYVMCCFGGLCVGCDIPNGVMILSRLALWQHLSLCLITSVTSVKHGRLMNSHLNGNAGSISEFILVAKI